MGDQAINSNSRLPTSVGPEEARGTRKRSGCNCWDRGEPGFCGICGTQESSSRDWHRWESRCRPNPTRGGPRRIERYGPVDPAVRDVWHQVHDLLRCSEASEHGPTAIPKGLDPSMLKLKSTFILNNYFCMTCVDINSAQIIPYCNSCNQSFSFALNRYTPSFCNTSTCLCILDFLWRR